MTELFCGSETFVLLLGKSPDAPISSIAGSGLLSEAESPLKKKKKKKGEKLAARTVYKI